MSRFDDLRKLVDQRVRRARVDGVFIGLGIGLVLGLVAGVIAARLLA